MIIFRARSPSSAHPRVSYPPSPGVENPSNRDARRAERIPHSYPNRSLRGIRLHHRLHPRQRTRSTRPPRLSDQDRRARAARSRDIFLSKRETNERKTNERRWFTRNDDDGTTTTTTTTNIYNGYVIARTRRRRRPSRRKNRFDNNQSNTSRRITPSIRFHSSWSFRGVSRGGSKSKSTTTYLYGESQRPSSRQRVFVRSHRARPSRSTDTDARVRECASARVGGVTT